MTIATSVRTAGPYTGTGLVSVYPFSFKVFQTSDVLVTSTNTLGAISTLVLSSDYSVTLNADQEASPGGTVNLTVPLASGYALYVTSNVSATQPASLTNAGGFFPKVIEAALDRLTILLQQSGLLSSRALKVPVGETISDLPSVASRANMALTFNAVGAPIATVPASGSAADVLVTIASATDATKGAGAVGLGVGLAYEDGSLGDQALAVRAFRRGRTSPHANFNWFTSLFTVTGCHGPGQASLLQDISDVFTTTHGGSLPAGTLYVGPNGNDGTGDGSRGNPYLTLNKALRTSTAGTVRLLPNTIATAYDMGGGWRSTDTNGSLPKKLIAEGQPCYIAPPAPVTLSSVTWTAVGGHANIWKTTTGTSSQPVRILQTDRLDAYGDPTPLRLVDPFGTTLATALNDLDTLGEGWFFDTATGVLYVRRQLESVEATTKASLLGMWGQSGAGVENHFLIQNAILYVEGVTLFGYWDILNSSGTTPQLWRKNCTMKYAVGNSINVNGGYSYGQGDIARRSTVDHANYNIANGVTPRGAEINFTTSHAGDIGTFGSGASQPANPVSTSTNKNGSSNHDAYVVRVNGRHDDSYGPPIADTATSYTWCLGTITGFSYAATGGSQRYGFLMQGNAAWLDGCQAAGGLDAGFNSDSSAVVKTFNCLGTQIASSGGSFSAYVPT
jgi:hypothetical protein